MHSYFPGLLVVAALVPAGLQPQAPNTPASPSPRTLITLTGCVSATPDVAGQFLFHESERGSRFRLAGKGARNYAGQHVEIVGRPDAKRLTIRGGLWPSPNVAAQAGAIDPAQEAVAHQPGGGTSGTGAPLVEFRVTRLRGVNGACQ